LAAHPIGSFFTPGLETRMIRIDIVDDPAIVRAGLKQYLAEQVNLRVTAEAANGRAGPICRG